ncbi:hypothetical protein KI387_017086, partial [Taxus chinensis]
VPANIADDSENNVDFLHEEDFSGGEILSSNSCDTEGTQNLLQRKENGNAESSSNKSYIISESSSEKHSVETMVKRDTSNQFADFSLGSFAHFPLTTEDEEK